MRTCILISTLALILGVINQILFLKSQEKVGHIDSIKVYNDFQMKVELEKKLVRIQKTRESELDSLLKQIEKIKEGEYSFSSSQEQNKSLVTLQNRYLLLEEKFDSDNKESIIAYQDQIWRQLNQYIKEFAIDKDYRMIWGASGDGSLVYSSKGNDLTDEIIEYSNLRYNDNSK